jgi:hypothetical protein
MESKAQTPLRSICLGAIQGVVAWTIYAVIECWLTTVMPSIVRTEYQSTLYHWGFTLLVFCSYALIGAMVGGIIGWGVHYFAKRNSSGEAPEFGFTRSALISFTLALVFFINLVMQTGFGLSAMGLAVLLLLTSMILALSVLWRTWREKFGFLSQPTIIGLIFLGETWILFDVFAEHVSRIIKAGVASLFLVSVVLISAAIHRKSIKLRRFDSRNPDSPSIRGLAVLSALVVITVGVSAWKNQPPAPLNSKASHPPARAECPNVILLVMDTVRADHLSLYGYERDTTPNLRALAEEATVYGRAFAPSDITLTSHASLFTGLYARRHGAHRQLRDFPHGKPLADDFTTLAEALSRESYWNTAVISNHIFLGPEFGLAQGFDHYDYRRAIVFLQPSQDFYLRNVIYGAFKRFAPLAVSEK